MTIRIAFRHAFAGFTLDADFQAPAGVTALFGHSGSGKTTLVNAVAGLLRPDTGRIEIAGRVLFDSARGIWLPPHRRRLGYVFQDARLFPHLSVRQNLHYGRWFAGLRDGAGFDRVADLLGIGHLLERRPRDLSGGETQRVAIGRALLSDPQLLLMDEPLAALDAARKSEILPYLERIRDESGVPILYVSHSVAEIARLATTIVALEDGRIRRAGPAAEVLADPDAVPVLGSDQAGAVLSGRVIRHHTDGLTEIAVSDGSLFLPRVTAPDGSSLRIRIEAREVMLALERPGHVSALNILPAHVVALRDEGAGVMVALASGQDRLLAQVTARSAKALGLTPGLPVHAIVKSVSVARGDVGIAAPAR